MSTINAIHLLIIHLQFYENKKGVSRPFPDSRHPRPALQMKQWRSIFVERHCLLTHQRVVDYVVLFIQVEK
jgi:hypothetical protein